VETPGRSGSELQELASLSRRALNDGLESLQRLGRIRYEPGPRGAKLWHPVEIGADLSDLSDPSGTGADRCAGDLSDLSPKGGQDRSDRSAAPGELLEFAPRTKAAGTRTTWTTKTLRTWRKSAPRLRRPHDRTAPDA
jgi:hypothetical protein